MKWIWNIQTDVILWPLQLKSLAPLYWLHQEANYEQEAKNAQMFAENFGDDPTVKIPKAGFFFGIQSATVIQKSLLFRDDFQGFNIQI